MKKSDEEIKRELAEIHKAREQEEWEELQVYWKFRWHTFFAGIVLLIVLVAVIVAIKPVQPICDQLDTVTNTLEGAGYWYEGKEEEMYVFKHQTLPMERFMKIYRDGAPMLCSVSSDR